MDIKKPEKYENVKLGAEKTEETKFKTPRHFIQNTVTHYNFFFNANIKLEEIIARAKAQHKDDFTKLLSFYNYSLDATARDKRELDSILYKCTAGILNHDLRNDWIDNLYMLMGKAYFFRKQLDSAYITFQYMNYAFSPKDKDGYDKVIGSNENEEENGTKGLVVSTHEKTNIAKKIFSLPPSRNDALLWQVRTYIATQKFEEASGLIETLKQDPVFPERLKSELEEVQALWFYEQNLYDSAAHHLENALGNATGNDERSRWEYLIAQLYEKEHKPIEAQEFYKRSYEHSYDPVMEVYARLNYIRQNNVKDDKLIQQNIDALMSMGRKARFENYRDIIYYTAAQMELDRKGVPAAENLLLRSIKFALPENNQKNKAFLQLGDLYLSDRNYRSAKRYYDSVNASDKSTVENPNEFLEKRKTLDRIIASMDVIARQDSLQRIAGWPKDEREAYIKKLVKKLRKLQGLAEEEQADAGSFTFNNNNNAAPNLFDNNGDNTQWYFYNPTLKAKGFGDFKSKWGNRKNTDFWQISSKASQFGITKDNQGGSTGDNQSDSAKAASQISFQSLLDKLPLTPEKMKKSNDSIENSLFLIGKSYQEGLLDYQAAITSYDSLLSKFPNTPMLEETWFNQYYCYKKLGDDANAARILKLMNNRYPNSKLTNIASYPEAYKKSIEAPKQEATRRYENIYNSFIEGRFEEAVAAKRAADSSYGDKYWTPQLLYIESVYFIKQREDSAAKSELNRIIMKFPGTAMAAKAKTFLDVLGRRKEIEIYLSNLKITRTSDDSVVTTNAPAKVKLIDRKTYDSLNAAKQAREDSLSNAKEIPAKAKTNLALSGQKKKDSVSINMPNNIIDRSQLMKVKADSAQIAKLQQQMDSIQTAMLQAKNDAEKMAKLKKQADSISNSMKKAKADSVLTAQKIASFKSAFAYAPDKPQAVAILMNKVDPVYINETKNAFSRYNQENFYSLPLEITTVPLNDTIKLVLIKGFVDANKALEYMGKAKIGAPRDIVPWLPVGKYSFWIITDQNLETLISNKDITGYRKFLEASFPGKF